MFGDLTRYRARPIIPASVSVASKTGSRSLSRACDRVVPPTRNLDRDHGEQGPDVRIRGPYGILEEIT